MEDYEEMTSTPFYQSPAPRRSGRRWLLIGGLVFAFMLALGTGLVLSSLNGTSQASALAQGGTGSSQTLVASQGNFNNSPSLTTAQGSNNGPQSLAAGPEAHGSIQFSKSPMIPNEQIAQIDNFLYPYRLSCLNRSVLY